MLVLPFSCYGAAMSKKRDKRLGNQIKKARKHQGLTQEDLAELIKVSTHHLQTIELGMSHPSLRVLYKIADKLGVKVGDLFPHSS